MTTRVPLALDVNGERRECLARTDATLLDVLREQLALTGSKRGCNHGVCGACTVLVDGKLARACLMLAADAQDRAITTVEGITGDAAFSPVQRALVESGAIQCGFCTPGFVVALTALFADSARPTRGEIRDALSGNLCRCSGYVKIVEAAERLAAERP